MPVTAEALKSQLLTLGERERLELAEFLYNSVPDERPDDIDEEYWKEINRRSDEIDAGTAKGRTLDEIMADLGPRFE
jgi:putative addiction module component (TIGR02574 family)